MSRRRTRIWQILRAAEYDTIQLFAACGITGAAVFFIARAT